MAILRKNLQLVRESLQKRNSAIDIDKIIALDEKKRDLDAQIQQIQAQRNKIAKEIGILKRNNDANSATNFLILEKESTAAATQMEELQAKHLLIKNELNDRLLYLPNILQDDVPVGKNDEDNKEIKKHGILPVFTFTPLNHYDLPVAKKYLDFEVAANMSGARFNVMKGPLARLERALCNFMLDMHTNAGFTEVKVPHLIKEHAMQGSGQLPHLRDDMFATQDNLFLIPTSEVALVNMVRETMLDEDSLPLRFTAYSQCFRKEAGAAGSDTRGLIRQREFSKVELVCITTPQQSAAEHEKILLAAESVLQALDLHYRVVLLCSGDTGFSSQKTYDIEVWLPGSGKYREISSCSNVGSFQARRMETRIKMNDASKEIAHTLNGSSVAVGRAMVAIMENYQNENGQVVIPKALRPYMNGLEILE